MESSTLEPSIADIIIRSRQTVLDILEDRGYDAMPYRNIAPDQILTLVESSSRTAVESSFVHALNMTLNKKADSAGGANAPCDRAAVVYIMQERNLRGRLGTFTRDVYEGSDLTKADDIMVLVNEPWHDIFDKTSLQMWQQQKARITFFHLKQVVVHPGRHVLVPPHRKLNVDEAKAEMTRWSVTSKIQFPIIKHSDIQAKLLGLVPGDVVEILRPSPTSGIARVLRICAA
jgi:DNA-directed RNA polymerase subunit H (RpoH/RPB5)